MTTPKEALELKPCPLCGGKFLMSREPHDNAPVGGMFYIYHDYGPLDSPARKCPIDVQKHFESEADAVVAWNTRATASLQGEDAVERVAQTIREYCIGVSPASIQLSHGVERIYYAGLPVLELARAILATGLVPDEAAIRADQREIDAKIAEDDERQDEWPKSVDVNRTSPSRIMQRTIAAAIRSGGGE